MNQDDELRKHVINLLDMKGAHIGISETLERIPFESLGKTVSGAPYTLWQVFEHMRIAQWDILEFSKGPDHESPEWPDGYWPDSEAPSDKGDWEEAVRSFERDLEAFKKLVRNRRRDLYQPFSWGEGQTLLREALLVADHNSYHLGQMVLLIRELGHY